jgi:hypothetical protein
MKNKLIECPKELVKKFPKAFQKRLKCIVGVWWMSLCDPHDGVAKLSSEGMDVVLGEEWTKVPLMPFFVLFFCFFAFFCFFFFVLHICIKNISLINL